MFAALKVTTRVPMLSVSSDTGPQSFYRSFIALSKIGCSKSAQKSAVQVCLVATVDMETTQLVLNQFYKVFIVVNAELNEISRCQK